ncbi:Asp-domain-containing protein [Gyrodon lividus]|nr:Asp-domain-containing protein [Gyrodon lividus]
MRFTLATIIVFLPFAVAAASRSAKQGGKTLPLFKHSSMVNADKSVNIEALKSDVASTAAKILRGLDNFEKNTGASHPSAVKDARKRASAGQLLSFNPNPNIWFGLIDVGDPIQVFSVGFDTGSSDLVLPGIDCDGTCDGHEMYDPELSETSFDVEEPFIVHYESGDNAFGKQYTDTVSLNGLTAFEQTLGAASHYSDGFAANKYIPDGLMGMAFQSISVFNQSPVFQTLFTQGQTDKPIFAFSLAAPDPELYIGGTNPNMYIGDFSWAHVIQHGFWQVNMDNVMGNGQIVLTDIPCVIDTGTDLIHGPPGDVETFYDAIGGILDDSGFYFFPCDPFPNVVLTFGGTPFPIPADALNIGNDSDDPSYCAGAIVSADIPYWIAGGIFLSTVYTAFDVVNARVGFATLAQHVVPTASSMPVLPSPIM